MKHSPIHFGTYLKRQLKDQGLSVAQLAVETNLPAQILEQLIAGDQILTGDVAFLLADYFKVSPLDLFKIQSSYHLASSRYPDKALPFAA